MRKPMVRVWRQRQLITIGIGLAILAGAPAAAAAEPLAGSGPLFTRAVTLWDGPLGGGDYARSVAVSPDGRRVFVTGDAAGPGGIDFGTVAYESGTKLWEAGFASPGFGEDEAHSVEVSPDGTLVYVSGYSTTIENPTATYPVTIAYDAATGTQRWRAFQPGANEGQPDRGPFLRVSPTGAWSISPCRPGGRRPATTPTRWPTTP